MTPAETAASFLLARVRAARGATLRLPARRRDGATNRAEPTTFLSE